MRYRDKVVIVTGAASGIGRATAQRLAVEGATLVLGDVNEQGARAVADMLDARATPLAIGFDAGDPASCRAFIATAAQVSGRIDMLCNVAGIMDWGPLAQFGEERWERMMRVNLSSIFYLCQAAMPHLVQTKGNIVNISSAAGLVGIAYTTAYCAAKHGVIGLTKSLAIEFASAGVRVNAICPTGVKTPMSTGVLPEGVDVALLMRNASKMGDLIEAEEVAGAIAYLGSEDARTVSGIALPVDGAQTAG
ncbi:SDR family NAD(P)-dependent oxidoreductase [Sphingobium sp. EP60837]|uniref:SDR family NAD(P)-dependent oxidoreductase n=1 Tax=Sphingobium sp. EP60837 TaxID=1855519 RepID=UPI0007DDECFE|nr:SDR family NAD(P)-dependent oxidoreductase [Sphingobium sp. EP60837]ANI79353.1 Levodione reductase [Sphingobium sp. EP60837]